MSLFAYHLTISSLQMSQRISLLQLWTWAKLLELDYLRRGHARAEPRRLEGGRGPDVAQIARQICAKLLVFHFVHRTKLVAKLS